jgi:flagellar biosynthesis GTPase FlhF
MNSIRREIEHLNLVEIVLTKNDLEKSSNSCEGTDAIVIVGKTGVGKTTTIHGMSGHHMIWNSKT